MKYKNIVDVHTHSIHSFDGNDSVEALCLAAIEKGAERIRNIKQEPAVLAQAKEEQAEVQASEKQEKKAVDKDVLIRQILEEYMA